MSSSLTQCHGPTLPQEWERLYGKSEFDSVVDGVANPAPVARVRGEYVFSPNNPFLGDKEAFEKGKDLFRCEEV